jgi:ribonuclease E
MTPEEQDIYALMGISPLVLTTEAIKDPKAVVVMVNLPGETPVLPNGSASSEEVTSSSPMASLPLSTNGQEPVIEAVEATVEESAPPIAEVVVEEPETAEESNGENGLANRRRRRRRSSSVTDSSAD